MIQVFWKLPDHLIRKLINNIVVSNIDRDNLLILDQEFQRNPIRKIN